MSECLVFSLRKKTLREKTRPYRYHGLKIFTSLKLRFQDFQRQLSYRYEFYISDDYALDNISTDSIDEVLSLGNSSADYNAHVVGLSAFYEF